MIVINGYRSGNHHHYSNNKGISNMKYSPTREILFSDVHTRTMAPHEWVAFRHTVASDFGQIGLYVEARRSFLLVDFAAWPFYMETLDREGKRVLATHDTPHGTLSTVFTGIDMTNAFGSPAPYHTRLLREGGHYLTCNDTPADAYMAHMAALGVLSRPDFSAALLTRVLGRSMPGFPGVLL